MNTAAKPASDPIARYRCVASWVIVCRFKVIATKTKPVSAAAPPPTITKKSCHWSG